ncbi:HAD family hydrolase [Luteitalea sp.]
MSIHAVLFDADGVIQKPAAHRRDAWQSVLGSDRELDAFVAAIFEAEIPALEGRSDFGKALTSLLGEWECCGTMDDALRAWTMIEADAEIIGILRALRRSGVACHLASNQEPHKAAYMSETLGYSTVFTREFYSCWLGVMKPHVAYFHEILGAIDVPARNLLFVDDNAANVASAREAGLHAVQFHLDAGAAALTRTLMDFGLHVSVG